MDLPKSRIGCKTNIKTIEGKPITYTVIDDYIFPSISNNRKAFCIQKIQFDDGHEEFRVIYYMMAEKPRMHGKWAYGQFAPMMNKEEMTMVFQKAKERGWI